MSNRQPRRGRKHLVGWKVRLAHHRALALRLAHTRRPESWPRQLAGQLRHACFLSDGRSWRVALAPPPAPADDGPLATGLPVLAWSKHVAWSNGTTTFVSRMERPQVVLDAGAILASLACPGT